MGLAQIANRRGPPRVLALRVARLAAAAGRAGPRSSSLRLPVSAGPPSSPCALAVSSLQGDGSKHGGAETRCQARQVSRSTVNPAGSALGYLWTLSRVLSSVLGRLADAARRGPCVPCISASNRWRPLHISASGVAQNSTSAHGLAAQRRSLQRPPAT